MQEITATTAGNKLAITRADGVVIESACAADGDALSARELLAASLASCIAASLAPLLARHRLHAAELRIRIAAQEGPLAQGFSVDVTLPAGGPELLLRCQRAAAACPVLRALNIPVDIHWRMS